LLSEIGIDDDMEFYEAIKDEFELIKSKLKHELTLKLKLVREIKELRG
jgi:hypothetical protein